jgi:hypothetical protein
VPRRQERGPACNLAGPFKGEGPPPSGRALKAFVELHRLINRINERQKTDLCVVEVASLGSSDSLDTMTFSAILRSEDEGVLGLAGLRGRPGWGFAEGMLPVPPSD